MYSMQYSLFTFCSWLALLLLPTYSCGSCIPPLTFLHGQNGEQKHAIAFDGSPGIIQRVNSFIDANNMNAEDKIRILEGILEHVNIYSGAHDIENGELFMRLDSKAAGLATAQAAAAAVAALPADRFPARAWSTASAPSYQIVLDDKEFMSQSVMHETESFMYKQIDMLIKEFRTRKKLQPGIVVDVGANLGMFALYAAAAGERVVAFEATSSTAELLKASCVLNGWCAAPTDSSNPPPVNYYSRNSRFAIVENAVSGTDGEEVTMRLNWHSVQDVPNAGANSMFAVDNENSSTCSFETKRSVTLDSALTSLGLLPEIGANAETFQPSGYISILKLDCEGCEPGALSGGSRLFKYNAPLAIMLEVNRDRLEAAGSSPYLFLRQIELLGYRVFNNQDASPMSPVSEPQIQRAFHSEQGNMIGDCVAILQRFF